MELNRRDFLKGGAVLGSAAAIGGLAGCAAAPATTSNAPAAAEKLPAGTTAQDFASSVVELDPITTFAEELDYDIVVIGAGTAGIPATYAALEEGAKVACLQKESLVVAHGNGSAGFIIEESSEIGALQYKQAWRESSSYRVNPDLLDQFVQYSGETAMWMLKMGNEVGLAPAASLTKNEYDEGSYCTLASNYFGPKPVNNADIMKALAEAAEKEGAEFFYSTPAVQLVMDDNGAVTGVIGAGEKGYVKFNASKAVIIAAGDYQNNESLVERYSPDIVRFNRKQHNKTGDGILLAMTAGAVMAPVNHAKTMHDMDAAPMLLTFVPFMAVDEEGKRFMNEDIPMESWDLALNARPSHVEDPGKFCRIFDNEYTTKYNVPVPPEALENYIPGFLDDPKGVYIGLTDTHRADTLEELAEMLDMPAAGLVESVKKWNEHCEAGADSEFGLGQEMLKPIDTPPYWATRQWIRCSAINAGVLIDGNCRVLDAKGEPIVGLYSAGSGAGNACGDLEWSLYQGGFCCGSYMTNGRYAAIHAATGGMTPSKAVSIDEVRHYWA